MVKVTITGALGRMGRRITELCLEDKEIEIVALIESKHHRDIGRKVYPSLPEISYELEKFIPGTDVVIDFSSPEATEEIVRLCELNKKPIVIGTTAHSVSQVENIKFASKTIPIVFSPNMSVGVNLMFKLIEYTMKVLKDKDYDIEIVEAHHNKKKDAPSGTAKKISEIIKTFRPESRFIFSREGIVGERKKEEIGVFSIRAGDIVGEHLVLFSSYGERLEIKHTATSRDTFAKGAILASKWVVHRDPGLYSMLDVLGL